MGEKKKSIKELTAKLEDEGYDYRFVRGLSLLLDRRSVFKCVSRIDPVALRRRIFQTAGKIGLPTTMEQRNRLIETVGSELELSRDVVDELYYADLDSELVLERFEPIPPQALLEEYNLSLTQTLLFDSTELSFTASGNWQQIFYTTKRLGLIYEVWRDRGFWVRIDGPSSLFKLTRRYGTALAKLLPVIIANPEWIVESKILWKYTNEICSFKIESSKHGMLLRSPQVSMPSYDSLLEKDFAERFQALHSGWSLKREPEPIQVGKQVFIPDFSLEKDGMRVYMEIMGFWTLDYLNRKVEKLRKIDVDMLLAVDETLACGKLAELEDHGRLSIFYYKNSIPLGPILQHLAKVHGGVQAEQIKSLKDLPIVFTEPVVNYQEFANRIGVSVEVVKKTLVDIAPLEYAALANDLVRKDKLLQIRERIEEQITLAGKLLLSEGARIIEAEGVQDPSSVLENLGYKTVWHGINAEKAEVTRPESKNE